MFVPRFVVSIWLTMPSGLEAGDGGAPGGFPPRRGKAHRIKFRTRVRMIANVID